MQQFKQEAANTGLIFLLARFFILVDKSFEETTLESRMKSKNEEEIIWDLWPLVPIAASCSHPTHYHQHHHQHPGIDYRCLILQLSTQCLCPSGETIISSTSCPQRSENQIFGNRNKSKSDKIFPKTLAEPQAAVSQVACRGNILSQSY